MRPISGRAARLAAPHLAPLAGAGIAALLLAEALSLALSAAVAASAGVVTLGRAEGQLAGQRLAVALLLWLARGATRSAAQPRLAAGITLALGLLMAALDGASAAPPTALPLQGAIAAPWWAQAAIEGVHVLAMAAWTGAVVALVRLWPRPELRPLRPALLTRTARLAVGCVVILAATGTFLAALHLPSWSALGGTTYGRVLLAKLALFLLVLAVAGWGQRRRPVAPERWWRAEIATLAGVAALAATLISLPPPA